MRAGNPAGAIAPLKKAAADASLAEEALYLLEESCRLSHDTAGARQAFHELYVRYPDSGWTHYLIGAAYENEADHEKAIAEYRAALAKDPKIPNANFAIGYILWEDRAFQDAKQWLTKELAVQPCHSLACAYLAEIARTDGDREGAVKLYRRAIRCDGRNAKAHLGLAVTLADMKQDSEAVQEFRRTVELTPDDATPHYRLAVLYRKLGRTAEAEAELKEVERIHNAGHREAEEGLRIKR